MRLDFFSETGAVVDMSRLCVRAVSDHIKRTRSEARKKHSRSMISPSFRTALRDVRFLNGQPLKIGGRVDDFFFSLEELVLAAEI